MGSPLLFLVGGNGFGPNAAGVIGQNFLQLADQEYDLGHAAVRLWVAKDCANSALAYWVPQGPYSVVAEAPLDPNNRQARADAYVNGVKVRVILDTGSPTSVLSRAAAKRAGVNVSSSGVTTSGEMIGIGRHEVSSWVTPIEKFQFGDEQILHTHVRVAEFSGLDADMLLGMDFLLSHRVLVANSQGKIYFTYSGGPVFNLTTTPDAKASADTAIEDGAAPTDADGWARRAAALAARAQYAPAVAAYSRALELAPNNPEWLFQRGALHMRANQPAPALVDLNAAIALKPDNPDALMLRAQLQLSKHDSTRALADLALAEKAPPRSSEARFELAQLYVAAGDPTAPFRQYNFLVRAYPDDARLAEALNGRCWTRALAKTELDKALADCDASLRRSPKSWGALDSRGLVRLRQGDYDKAIADYDEAIALQPTYAWSIYCRGLAKLKKGMTGPGKADIAAATAIDPKIADEAGKYGLTP